MEQHGRRVTINRKFNTFDAGLMYLYLSMKLASYIFDAVLGT